MQIWSFDAKNSLRISLPQGIAPTQRSLVLGILISGKARLERLREVPDRIYDRQARVNAGGGK